MNKLMLLLIVLTVMLASCVYPPEWGSDPAPTDDAMALPPGVSDQPFDLPYPELPWNHVCNVEVNAGGCDNSGVEDNPEGY